MDEPYALGMQKCHVNVNTPQVAPQAHPDALRLVKKSSSHKVLSLSPVKFLMDIWIPNLVSLNNQGQAYLPYGSAGIPYSLGGGSTVKWTPIGADASNP